MSLSALSAFWLFPGGQDEPEIEELLKATQSDSIDFEHGKCCFTLSIVMKAKTDVVITWILYFLFFLFLFGGVVREGQVSACIVF